VGGSSACNFMIYHRPSRGSLDKWAELTGDSEWTFGKRFGDYKKSVSFTPPKVSSELEMIHQEGEFKSRESNDILFSMICAGRHQQLNMMRKLSSELMGQFKSRTPSWLNLFRGTCNSVSTKRVFTPPRASTEEPWMESNTRL
jgi:hypothetical protein